MIQSAIRRSDGHDADRHRHKSHNEPDRDLDSDCISPVQIRNTFHMSTKWSQKTAVISNKSIAMAMGVSLGWFDSLWSHPCVVPAYEQSHPQTDSGDCRV